MASTFYTVRVTVVQEHLVDVFASDAEEAIDAAYSAYSKSGSLDAERIENAEVLGETEVFSEGLFGEFR